MLDNETKRRIDSARDILVGKLPDPKSQVEQITIALIYKFMDDMDKEAIEFGGKPSFFTGEYEKYGWSKIFDPRLGGYEMLALYGEAIEKLDQNPNIPQLFRDIFKNAYLPYRDPETLKLFLKTINEFHYDHSEKLGDAFEYLLSVLGSQGDAGQFRTPRHIIDFIVNVLQPKKNETILDPACGTAGFLISSYKYILKNNSLPAGEGRGGALTPNDRKKLMGHFTGYDISPDMVRLSLVNMYLHHFTSPRIYEYDTLTSEDRWGDYFDIVMANPPFMTPKGGIKPHKKFTMQANRSEVLFVDYIAEHINPTTGRAGVIVPEGIIFQSATAYKALRKLLVDKKYLYAVVSLPAGIFNPYSGVKTSILLMDKTIAKKTDKILFVKIENDGFGLGAQRKAITKNDLTDALEVINNYQLKIKNDEAVEALGSNYLLVEKEKIKANTDYNLSVDRYRVNDKLRNVKYDIVSIGQVCEVYNGSTPLKSKNEFWENGTINWFTIDDIREQGRIIRYTKQKITEEGFNNSSVKLLPKNSILLCCTASVGEYAIIEVELTTNQQFNGLVIKKEFKNKMLPKYLFYVASTFKNELERLSGKTSFNFVSVGTLKGIEFPLPPLSIQQEMVNKIEGWQKIIDGAKQIIENYKPQIDINPDWEMVKLGDVCEIFGGGTPSKQNEGFWINGTIKWISSKYINDEGKITGYDLVTEEGVNSSSSKISPKDSTILITRVSVGRSAYADDNYAINQDLTALIAREKYINPKFLFLLSRTFSQDVEKNAQGIGVRGVTKDFVSNLEISLPSLSIQQQIVNRIEQEQQLINSNKQLIKIFEQKIKDEINKLWQTDTKEYAIEDEKLSLVAEE